jgi:hypothetical protein
MSNNPAHRPAPELPVARTPDGGELSSAVALAVLVMCRHCPFRAPLTFPATTTLVDVLERAHREHGGQFAISGMECHGSPASLALSLNAGF